MSTRPLSIRLRRLRASLALLGGVLLLLALAPLIAHAQAADTLILIWTAPGDDGNLGTATAYEMRMAQFPIDDGNWGTASLVGGLPNPTPNGTRQQVVVRGLTRGQTYWFAIKAVDDNSNWSGLSNVLRWDWVLDTTAPLAPLGVTARREGSVRDVRVSWNANPEPDLAGYSVYRRDTPGGSFQRVNGATLTGTQLLDTNVPSGSDVVWYQVIGQRRERQRERAQRRGRGQLLRPTTRAGTLQAGLSQPEPRQRHADAADRGPDRQRRSRHDRDRRRRPPHDPTPFARRAHPRPPHGAVGRAATTRAGRSAPACTRPG